MCPPAERPVGEVGSSGAVDDFRDLRTPEEKKVFNPKGSEFGRVGMKHNRCGPMKARAGDAANSSGFGGFVKRIIEWSGSDNSALASFLGKYYLPSRRCEGSRWASPRGHARPFPCWPEFAPEDLVFPSGPRSRRRSRYTVKFYREVMSNAITGFLSWEALGRPSWVGQEARGEWVPTKRKLDGGVDRGKARSCSVEAQKTVSVEVAALSCETFGGVSGGRTTVAKMLEGLSLSSYRGVEQVADLVKLEDAQVNERVATGDTEFLAERQGLPSTTAGVDVPTWLFKSGANVMRNPGQLIDDRPQGRCPRRYHSPKSHEWKKFLGRKVKSNMIGAVGLSKVPTGPRGESLWSGCFHVGKSAKEDRCIDDMRRINWRSKRWRGRKPGHGAHYLRGVILPGRRRRYNGLDAPHFYHNLNSGEAHAPHAPTGPPLTRAEVSELGIPILGGMDDGGKLLQPVSLTVCMGDGKGVTVATDCHYNMLRSIGIQEHMLMDWDMPDPPGDLRLQLCIDDVVLEEDLPAGQGDNVRTVGDAIVETIIALYEELGIPPKVEKIQLKRRIIVSLGAEVNGDSGRTGVPMRVISQVMMLTCVGVYGVPVTRKTLQKLKVYPFLNGLPDDDSAWPVPPVVRDELMSLVLMGCLMRSSQRWQVHDEVAATDAEGSGGSAIVVAKVDPRFAREVFRYCQVKGEYTTLHGDARELAAGSAVAERILREREEVDESAGKTELELFRPGPADEEEDFEGRKIGERVVAKRRRLGLGVPPPPGLESTIEAIDENRGEAPVWHTTLSEELFNILKVKVCADVLSLLMKFCLVPWKSTKREELEAQGELPPSLFLCRAVLAWDAPSSVVHRLKSVGWKVLELNLFLPRERGRTEVLAALEHAALEGAFGGWMELGSSPEELSMVREAIVRGGGFKVCWVLKHLSIRGWVWLAEEGTDGKDCDVVLETSSKLRSMLQGKKSPAGGEEEDDGRFLLGRRRQATSKSLVRGIEEHHENPTDTRNVKRRAWARTPWEAELGNLVETLDWRTVRSWRDRCANDEHINVLEMRGKRRYINRLSRRKKFFHKRHLHFGDSRVAQAVAGRGRSSAVKLNREQRLCVPDIVGADIAVPTFWVESARMAADEPSRGKAVLKAALATEREKKILSGDLPLVSRRVMREWRRGYWVPKPPPPLRRTRWGYRGVRVGEADRPGPQLSKVCDRREPLVKSRTPHMAAAYNKGYENLKVFLRESGFPSPAILAERHVRELNEALLAWIRTCYDQEMSKDVVRMGILCFSEKFWWVRPGLKPAWELIEEWELREPAEHRAPIPIEVVRAVIGVSMCWGWYRFAASVWLVYHALLRPGEFTGLKIKDVYYVEDEGEGRGVFVIIIRDPKTKRKYAKTQHVIVDEPLLVRLLAYTLAGRPAEEFYYGFTAGTFARRLESVLAVLSLEGFYTPAGLRAGGAAWAWVRERNFDALRLRGRWSAARTLEHYVQECVAELARAHMSVDLRAQLREIGLDGLFLVSQLVDNQDAGASEERREMTQTVVGSSRRRYRSASVRRRR